MPRRQSRKTSRRGGQEPESPREEGEVVGPRLPPPPPPASSPGLSNEPESAGTDPNAPPTGQGRRKSRRGTRKSRKSRKVSRRR